MSVFRGDEYGPARTYRRGRDALFPGMWCALDNEETHYDTLAAAGQGMQARDREWAAQWRRHLGGDPVFDTHHFSWRWTNEAKD